MESPVYEYEKIIRESHLDVFGHVNNAVYVQIMEEARWEFATKNGFGLDRVRELQIGPVILAMDLNFQRELRNRERIVVKSKYISIHGKLFVLQQSLVKENQEIACTGTFTFGLFDMRLRKMIDLIPEWIAATGIKL